MTGCSPLRRRPRLAEPSSWAESEMHGVSQVGVAPGNSASQSCFLLHQMKSTLARGRTYNHRGGVSHGPITYRT